MPIYEYSCTKCGATTEAMQKISDPPLKECPKCGGTLAKMISNSSFILKGSGWYATDYAKKGSGGNGSGNGKRTDHKDRLKEIESKKETPSVDSGSDTKADKPAEKAAKSGPED